MEKTPAANPFRRGSPSLVRSFPLPPSLLAGLRRWRKKVCEIERIQEKTGATETKEDVEVAAAAGATAAAKAKGHEAICIHMKILSRLPSLRGSVHLLDRY